MAGQGVPLGAVGQVPHLADTGRITEAIQAADAQALVDRLADGLDTQLGHQFDSVELSERMFGPDERGA